MHMERLRILENIYNVNKILSIIQNELLQKIWNRVKLAKDMIKKCLKSDLHILATNINCEKVERREIERSW
jgi:hypothetical protein